MGIGDDLMWLAQAQQQFARTGRPVRPTHRGSTYAWGRRLWLREAYENQPCIDPVHGVNLEEKPHGKRPYQYDPRYRPSPAQIILTTAEIQWAQDHMPKGPYVIINPDAKQGGIHHNNKLWHDPYWQELALQLAQLGIVTVRLKPATRMDTYYPALNTETDSIRKVMACIRTAAWVITTDGAQHHIAAAWATPCTVIWGTCTSPYATHTRGALGYEGQKNLIAKHPQTPCYTEKRECAHCVELKQAITPQCVIDTLDIQKIKTHGR
jgi:ADP-heptose:LPS heptosyltransferase